MNFLRDNKVIWIWIWIWTLHFETTRSVGAHCHGFRRSSLCVCLLKIIRHDLFFKGGCSMPILTIFLWHADGGEGILRFISSVLGWQSVSQSLASCLFLVKLEQNKTTKRVSVPIRGLFSEWTAMVSLPMCDHFKVASLAFAVGYCCEAIIGNETLRVNHY